MEASDQETKVGHERARSFYRSYAYSELLQDIELVKQAIDELEKLLDVELQEVTLSGNGRIDQVRLTKKQEYET